MPPRPTRQTRPYRRVRLAAAGLLLATPVLASCGFDEATNRVNQITAGASDQQGPINVLNVLIVSAEEGSGTLHGLLASLEETETVTVESVVGPGGLGASLEPIEIAPLDRAQLEDGDIRIEGDFTTGQVVPVTISFDNGEQVEIGAHVVDACGQYTGLDTASTDGDATSVEPGTDASETEPLPCGAATRGTTTDTGSAGEEEEAE